MSDVRAGRAARWLGANAPLTLSLAATLVVHGRALGSYFCGEDFLCFFQAAARPMSFLFRAYGGQVSTTFGAAIVALRALFGLHAPFYFAILLGTHLSHVALLYGIVSALGGGRWIAAVACGLWGATPAFQRTLGWFSAYDHLLGTTAVLWVLWELSRAAESRRPPTPLALLRMNVVLLVGAGAAGVGWIAAASFPAIAYFLLPDESLPRRAALWLLPASLSSISLAAVIVGDELVRHYRAHAGDLENMFSAAQVAVMFVELVAYGVGTVAAGPVVAADETGSRMGLTEVPSAATPIWVSAIAFLPATVLVVSRCVRGDRNERRTLVALLGLSMSTYALVALGRASVVPMARVAWMATRDRYHYIGTPALVVALALCAARIRPRAVPPRVAVLLGTVAAGWAGADWLVARDVARRNAGTAEWTRDYTEVLLGAIDWTLTRTPDRGTLYLRNDPFRSTMLQYTLGVPRVEFPGIAAFWIVARGLEGSTARKIRFVEVDGAVLAGIRSGYPAAVSSLFVAPEDVARASATVHTLAADAPPDVAEYLTSSVDPAFGPGDLEWGTSVRRSLAEATKNPAAPWRPARPTSAPSATVEADAIRQDPAAMEALRNAIRQDPRAMEAFRKAIQEDPAAMEQLRKAMQSEQQKR